MNMQPRPIAPSLTIEDADLRRRGANVQRVEGRAGNIVLIFVWFLEGHMQPENRMMKARFSFKGASGKADVGEDRCARIPKVSLRKSTHEESRISSRP